MSTPRTVVGVDPGMKGALAAIDVATGALLWIEDMPTTGRQVSGALLGDMVRDCRGDTTDTQWAVEQVGPRKDDTPVTAFGLGGAYHAVLAVLGALGCQVVRYRPQQWKGAMGLSADKERSRALFIETWPGDRSFVRYKSNDGRAEAALIGLYHARALRRTMAPLSPSAADPW